MTDYFTKKKEEEPKTVTPKKEEKEKEKKAVFLEPTKEQKEAREQEKKEAIAAVEEKYEDKRELDPKWDGLICGSCLQQQNVNAVDLRGTDEKYNKEALNVVQCSECKETDKPIRLYVKETEDGFIEVPARNIDKKDEKKE